MLCHLLGAPPAQYLGQVVPPLGFFGGFGDLRGGGHFLFLCNIQIHGVLLAESLQKALLLTVEALILGFKRMWFVILSWS